jgi:hypothetical protein
MKPITALALTLLAVLAGGLTTACSTDVQAMDAQQIELKYGVSGAYPETINTPDGPMKGMTVPVTLASGRQGHLFIPQRQATDDQAVYLRDEQGGLHPVLLSETASRESVSRSPQVVEGAPVERRKTRRSWETEALIIGGGAGGGAAIGAIAGGKKGAGVGAAAGGIGALIYDLTTRNKR